MSATEAVDPPETWLDAVHAALEQDDDETLRALFTGLEAGEVAHALEAFPQGARMRLLTAAAECPVAEVLLYLSGDAAARLGDEVGLDALEDSAAELDTVDLAELVDNLGDALAAGLLERLDIVRRREVEGVLAYDEGAAARVMHRDVVTVRGSTSVAVTLRYLKRRREIPDNTDRLMVVDREGHFLGTIGVLDLLGAEPRSLVQDNMEERAATVIDPELDEQEIIRLFLDRDLVSAPVVAPDGRLLGRVVASDVLELVQERAEDAMLARAGLDSDEDLFAPMLPSARNRAIWLGVNLATAFLAAWVIGLFQGTLEVLVALAVLMPVVASMGGIAGSQTLALTIRGLALGQIVPSNRGWLLRKEVGIGALNGVLWSLVVGVVAAGWFANVGLGVVIAAALIINMVAAALAGLLVPLTLNRLKFDPAIAGSVVLTTFTDVIGFFSFLGLATLFLL